MKKFESCKGIVSLLLCLLMLLACLPATVLAESATSLSLDGLTEITVEPDTEYLCSFTPEKTGYYRFYSVGDVDSYATLYNADMKELVYNDDAYLGENNFDFSVKYKLEAGEKYILEVAVYDVEDVTFAIGVEEGIAAVSGKLINGPEWDTVIRGYEYDTMIMDGIEVEFTLDDGTKEIWDAISDNLISGGGVITTPVKENGKFFLVVDCDEAQVLVPYTVIENPVKSIAYKGNGLTYYKETHGYWYGENGFYYDYDSDIKEEYITIEYTDGTSEELQLGYGGFYVDPSIGDTQETTPWQVGKNTITITYLGKETTIPVNILPCPYKNVTVNSNPIKEYIFGDLYNGDVYEGVYYFDAYDLTGISLTFENTDGTTVTYTAEDFDMENQELDGYEFSFDTVCCDKPGMADVCIYYKGFAVPFQVEVVESPIESLEILGTAKTLTYEQRYYPVLDGLSMKLTLKDGTSKIVELNDETVQYEIANGGLYYIIPIGDYTVIGHVAYDENDVEYYSFYCLDQRANYTGFTFVENREAVDVEVSGFTPDGAGMVLTVTYEHGTEILTVKKLDEQYWGEDYSEYVGKTENGILYYGMERIYDDEGKLMGYDLNILSWIVFFDVDETMGDLDGDGKINAKDALQVLKYSVGKVEFTSDQEVRGDVNGDGNINAKDALEILKHSVGKPSALDAFFAQ